MGLLSAAMKAAGPAAKGMAYGLGTTAATVGSIGHGIFNIAAKTPWYLSMPIAGAIGLAAASQDNRPLAAISRSPNIGGMNPNPGYYPTSPYNATSNIKDMGATGSLVLALNQLNH